MRPLAVVRALDRALSARQADLGARARDGPAGAQHRQARLQREPARHRPAHARRDRGGNRRHRALPGRQRLRAEAGARQALSRRHGRDRARQRLERRARAHGARLSRAGARGGALAALLRRLPARHAGARRALDRGAGEKVRPRPRGDGEGDRRRNLCGLDREPQQSDRHLRAPRGNRSLPQACARACACSAGRGVQRIPAGRAARRQRQAAEAASEPGHHPHLLEGLRPRRAARGLRARAPFGRGCDEPCAPAVQRQQHGADRGARRARRHGVRRAQLRREPAGPEAHRGGLARARPRLHPLARQLHHRAGRQGAGDLQAPAAPRRDRAARGRRLRPAGAPARHHRHCGRERTIP